MSTNIFDLVTENKDTSGPYALAVIVSRQAPSSGKPGDKAVINSKGEVKGWIGGGCTKGIVIKESLAAIADQKPRLVIIDQKETRESTPDTKYYKMTCQSGGTVEVFIEPIMQATQLLIIGRSHIAQALCKIAKASEFNVAVALEVPEDEMFPEADERIEFLELNKMNDPENTFIVVCTQGENDEQGLIEAINLNPRYLAFVSSRKKANSIYSQLKKRGITIDMLKTIKTPAGLDIQAKTPQEVAISILAEIVQTKRTVKTNADQESQTDAVAIAMQELDENIYINPVCNIPVQKDTAKHVLEYKGEKVYFCCDGCKVSFEKDPTAYM